MWFQAEIRAETREHQGPVHGETKNLKVKSGNWLIEEEKKKKKKKKKNLKKKKKKNNNNNNSNTNNKTEELR